MKNLINEQIETIKDLLTELHNYLQGEYISGESFLIIQKIEDELKTIDDTHAELIEGLNQYWNMGYNEGYDDGLKEGEEMYDEGRVI